MTPIKVLMKAHKKINNAYSEMSVSLVKLQAMKAIADFDFILCESQKVAKAAKKLHKINIAFGIPSHCTDLFRFSNVDDFVRYCILNNLEYTTNKEDEEDEEDEGESESK